MDSLGEEKIETGSWLLKQIRKGVCETVIDDKIPCLMSPLAGAGGDLASWDHQELASYLHVYVAVNIICW